MAASEQAAVIQPPEDLPLLPADVLTLVFGNLGVKDLAAAAQASKEWRVVAGETDAAWERAFLKEIGPARMADFAKFGKTWREKFIAACLDVACQKLRSKARYLDELEDSAAMLERNAQTLLSSLNQMDRTLGGRKQDLNALLALLAGHTHTHMDSRRGKDLLELAKRGGDLAAVPALTPDTCDSLLEMQRDVEFWKGSIAEERGSLHRMWDSLSYIQTCCNKVRRDVTDLQQRRAHLEAATRYRPMVRR